jgi:hypothetical protein
VIIALHVLNQELFAT